MPSSCPKCGKPLEVYQLKGVKYLDCSGYPECRYRVELGKVNQSIIIKEQNGKLSYSKVCPNCNKKLAIYIGKNGAFFGCNGYPKCKFSFNVGNIENILCPDCGSPMLERTGGRGIFLGCGGYPDCKFTYPIRISKNVENTITSVKSQRKKSVFEQPETPITITNDKKRVTIFALKLENNRWRLENLKIPQQQSLNRKGEGEPYGQEKIESWKLKRLLKMEI